MNPLDKVQATIKNGNEALVHNGKELGFSLLDFWRWNVSDLLSNATRGRFAEFIVASATGVNLDEVRDEWGAFDLITPTGVKIEIKSAAYVQSWLQKTLSPIRFSIKPARSWDDETNKRLEVASRSADVYVFCLLHHENKQTCDPMNLDHWKFYVVPTCELSSDRSISIKSLRGLTQSVGYNMLNEEISKKNALK